MRAKRSAWDWGKSESAMRAPLKRNGTTARTLHIEQISPAQQGLRVEVSFHGSHAVDLLGGELDLEQVALVLAKPVLGGHRASEFDGLTRELHHERLGTVRFRS